MYFAFLINNVKLSFVKCILHENKSIKEEADLGANLPM